MAGNFSLRDVTFHSSTEGVRIIAITDIACHLFCRLTLAKPIIHTRPSFRRGTWLSDDVRFCFTQFEDNEQYEAGDTVIHTFWKPSWPVCTTKWLYFFASISGEFAVSTSPIFEYHNDGVDPVSPPRVLDIYTSLEPQNFKPTSSGVWILNDASDIVDENATALIIQIVNRYASADVAVGLRKPGDATVIPSHMHQASQCWGVVGLSDAKGFEFYSSNHSYTDFFVMGYTNSRFVMLDTAVNLWDGFHNVWRSYDIVSAYPDARAAILDMGKVGGGEPWWGVRCGGSTDDRTQSSERSWCIVPLDDLGCFEFKVMDWPASTPRLQLIGYITGDIIRHINAGAIGLGVGPAWQYGTIKQDAFRPVLAVIEYDCSNPNVAGGVQKGYSRIEAAPYLQRKCWCFVHPAPNGIGNFMRSNAGQSYWRSIEFESEL